MCLCIRANASVYNAHVRTCISVYVRCQYSQQCGRSRSKNSKACTQHKLIDGLLLVFETFYLFVVDIVSVERLKRLELLERWSHTHHCIWWTGECFMELFSFDTITRDIESRVLKRKKCKENDSKFQKQEAEVEERTTSKRSRWGYFGYGHCVFTQNRTLNTSSGLASCDGLIYRHLIDYKRLQRVFFSFFKIRTKNNFNNNNTHSMWDKRYLCQSRLFCVNRAIFFFFLYLNFHRWIFGRDFAFWIFHDNDCDSDDVIVCVSCYVMPLIAKPVFRINDMGLDRSVWIAITVINIDDNDSE